MYVAWNSIEDYMRNGEFIPEIYSTIDIISKGMYVARDNSKDYMINVGKLLEFRYESSSLQNECM